MVGPVTHRITMKRQLGSSVSEKLKSRQAEEAAAKQERSVRSTDIGGSTQQDAHWLYVDVAQTRGRVKGNPLWPLASSQVPRYAQRVP